MKDLKSLEAFIENNSKELPINFLNYVSINKNNIKENKFIEIPFYNSKKCLVLRIEKPISKCVSKQL